MKETGPFFLIKKYRSILKAAIIVEAVSFFVSLTDAIVAGHVLGDDAFAAIGLISPFLMISTFVASIVNTGTIVSFSYQVGQFHKQRANEIFSQGLLMALLSGAIYAIILFLLQSVIISGVAPADETAQYLDEYYDIILIFFFLQPISCLLDNMLIADGGEKLSIAANVTQIVSNVVCSVIFAGLWDIRGIAAASVLSSLLFILIVCTHFLSKKNTLKFVRHWKAKDCLLIFQNGIVKASTYGLEALLTFIINLLVVRFFDDDTLLIMVAVERFLGMLTMFIGLSMASQPIVGTLRGEKNTWGQRLLMETAFRDMLIISLIISLITFFGAPAIAFVFGIDLGTEVFAQTVNALRIISSSLVFQAVLVLFFIYYVFIEKRVLAFFICLIKNFISPLVLAAVMVSIMHSQEGIWIGLSIAPVLAFLMSLLIVLLRYGRKLFPFLIPADPDQKTYNFDYVVTPATAVKMAEAVHVIMRQLSYPEKTAVFASLITEEMQMLIAEKNKNRKKQVRAECTLINRPEGMTLIFRDFGVTFDITDTDMSVDSFRHYVISNLMVHQENKVYLITTGYNRNEFYFQR